MAGNSLGDNNQTPVRNPPGAFHNSANSLAQHNLLGGIILWIKMQSFGIYKRLSSWCQSKRQRQHQQHQQNAAKPEQRQRQPQQLAARPHKIGKQHAQQQEQQQIKWLPLKQQPANHFSSLQRCATAYEQAAARCHKVVQVGTEVEARSTCGLLAYTQRGCLQQPSQWLIRQIDASAAACEESEVKMKYENTKSNELRNKVSGALEPLDSHMPMTLQPLALTAPFLHAISSGISATTTKATTRAMNLFFIKTMAANSVENFTMHMQKLAEHINAAEIVSVERRRYSLICNNNNNNNHNSENANGNSYVSASERVNKDTEQNPNVGNNSKRSNKTVGKVCANASRYSACDSRINENLLLSHTKLSFALLFVAVSLLLTYADDANILERYLPLLLLATYASQANTQKQLQQKDVRVRNSHLKTVCSDAGSNNNTPTTKTTTAFSFSCQSFGNAMKITSFVRIIRFLRQPQCVLWKSTSSTGVTTKTTTATVTHSQRQATISSRKRPTINRNLALAAAAAVSSTINTQVTKSTTTTTSRAAAALAVRVTSLRALCCGTALR